MDKRLMAIRKLPFLNAWLSSSVLRAKLSQAPCLKRFTKQWQASSVNWMVTPTTASLATVPLRWPSCLRTHPTLLKCRLCSTTSTETVWMRLCYHLNLPSSSMATRLLTSPSWSTLSKPCFRRDSPIRLVSKKSMTTLAPLEVKMRMRCSDLKEFWTRLHSC